MAVIIDKYNRILKERDAELEEGAKILFERYQMDLRDAHTAEILDHTGHADEFVQAFGKDRVAYAAIFNIAERNEI